MSDKVYAGLKEFQDHGLLWLLNAAVLHPRGYALALHFDDTAAVVGWSIMGDGSEPWTFGDDCDEQFAAVARLLAEASA